MSTSPRSRARPTTPSASAGLDHRREDRDDVDDHASLRPRPAFSSSSPSGGSITIACAATSTRRQIASASGTSTSPPSRPSIDQQRRARRRAPRASTRPTVAPGHRLDPAARRGRARSTRPVASGCSASAGIRSSTSAQRLGVVRSSSTPSNPTTQRPSCSRLVDDASASRPRRRAAPAATAPGRNRSSPKSVSGATTTSPRLPVRPDDAADGHHRRPTSHRAHRRRRLTRRGSPRATRCPSSSPAAAASVRTRRAPCGPAGRSRGRARPAPSSARRRSGRGDRTR